MMQPNRFNRPHGQKAFNNITPSMNPPCVSLSFLNWFVDENNLEIAIGVIHGNLVVS
jgi:hypothetical protein